MNQASLFAVVRVEQSTAGHMVLLRDGVPIAQGSMETIRRNGWFRWSEKR